MAMDHTIHIERYKKDLAELQDLIRINQELRERFSSQLSRVCEDFSNGKATLTQYDYVVERILRGRSKDDLFEEYDRKISNYSQQAEEMQSRIAELEMTVSFMKR